MKFKFIIVLAFILTVTVPLAASAAGAIPFGALVTFITPCNTGLLVKALLPGVAAPAFFMWFTGELPFLSYVPPHPGQYLLGMTEPTPVPCMVGPYTYGAGLPIIYHGSSI